MPNENAVCPQAIHLPSGSMFALRLRVCPRAKALGQTLRPLANTSPSGKCVALWQTAFSLTIGHQSGHDIKAKCGVSSMY